MRAGPGSVLLAALAGLLGAVPPAEAKKLIEFGWDEPDTAFMLAHAAMMEQAPFDGTVFHITYTQADGGRGRFTNECWGRRAFTAAELRRAADELARTRFRRFTDNFLRFNVQPGDVDWFDDFGAVTHNAREAARIARAGGARGILLDVEQYDRPLFEYRRQRDAARRSWDEYATQARRRGRDVMEAFQQGFGDELVVFLTFGLSLPHRESGGDVAKLPDTRYGLLKPFLEGMIDAARPGAKLVDGYELSYGCRFPEKFAAAAETVRAGMLPFVADPEKYRQTLSVAFGLWLDYDWARHGWNVADPSTNYFTPDGIEQSLRAALEAADEYAWVYTETPRWWSESGRVKVPAAYVRAIERARASTRGAAPEFPCARKSSTTRGPRACGAVGGSWDGWVESEVTGAERAAWDDKYRGAGPRAALANLQSAPTTGVIRAVLPLLRPGGRVLEAGSGTGRLVSHVTLERAARGVGLDSSWQANLGAARAAGAVGADVTFVSGDLCHLPFRTDFFDVVFSDSVIEHLVDPPGAVAEMARVARPGSYVVVTTPNRLRPDGWDLYKLRYRPQYLQRSFFPWQLGRLLERSGLVVERYFGDTLVLPRNFRLRIVRKTAAPGSDASTPSRPSRGIYRRVERAAERMLPPTMWVNIGVLAKKPGGAAPC